MSTEIPVLQASPRLDTLNGDALDVIAAARKLPAFRADIVGDAPPAESKPTARHDVQISAAGTAISALASLDPARIKAALPQIVAAVGEAYAAIAVSGKTKNPLAAAAGVVVVVGVIEIVASRWASRRVAP